jgi:hypothetical protein
MLTPMELTASCGDCHVTLDPISALGGSTQCPHCGSIKRSYGVTIEATQRQLPSMTGLARDHSTEKGFVESDRPDGASAFSTLSETTLSIVANGPASLGEKDTFATCQRLVRVLNTQGARWGVVASGSDDVDCAAADGGGGPPLQMQVVRALVLPEFWRRLSQRHSAGLVSSVAEAADSVFLAIQRKAQIPPEQRRTLVLVLDANRTAGLAFEAVVTALRTRHQAPLSSLGFLAIYVVGPDDALVKRIV